MKSKKIRIISALIVLILLIAISICIYMTNNKKDDKVTFECNYQNELIKAQVDQDLLKENMNEDGLLMFESAKEDNSVQYISILPINSSKTTQEELQLLEKYKNTLEDSYKVVDVSTSTNGKYAFDTYQLFDSSGNIITVYTKALSNDENTIFVTYFCGYSKDEDLNNAFKNAFDSITFK